MKSKKIIMGLIILVVGGFLLFLLDNKTFFKTKYENIPLPLFSYYKNNNTFHNVRSYKRVNQKINDYLEGLKKCENNDYYFDEKRNITIIDYSVKDSGMYNTITLDYEQGNICSEQFSLKDNWYKNINKVLNVEEIECISSDCDTKKVSIDIEKLKNDLSQYKRIENKDYVDFRYEDDNVYIGLYLEKETIKLFPYNDNTLGIISISEDENNKSALYNIESDVNTYLKSLIK